MADETKLKDFMTRKRILKSQFTRFENKTRTTELLDLAEIKLAKEKCENFRLDFKEVFNEIYRLCEEENIDEFILEEHENGEKIDQFYLELVRKIDKNESSHSSQSENIKLQFSENVKLPRISLPVFSGNFTEYLAFRDIFTATVINNTNISDVQKLQYLKLSLKGDPYRIIQSIPLSDQNFKIAWDLIQERYSNTKEQVYAFIKRLINLSPIQNESAYSILNLVDNVYEISRSLEILGQNIDNFSDTLITYLILQKIDVNTKVWFERHESNKEKIPKLKELLEFLKSYARTLQTSKCASTKTQKNVISGKTMALITNIKCKLCNEAVHNLTKCQKFLDLPVQKRVEYVKSNNVCQNCLSAHYKKPCYSQNRCKVCSKFHNSLIHIESKVKFRNTPKLSPDAKPFIPYKQNEPELPNTSNDLTACINNHQVVSGQQSFRSKQILMCTALIKVADRDNNLQMARCILDTGSQTSYVTKEFAEMLALKRKRKNVTVSCLGNMSTTTEGELELLFCSHFDNRARFKTSAYVLEKITQPLPHKSLDESLGKRFGDLQLADPNFYQSSEIEVLLGVNVFLTLINGIIIKRDEQLPFALDSKIGWIISGETYSPILEVPCVAVTNLSMEVDTLVRSFWELEQIPQLRPLTSEENRCEQHFHETHFRKSDGRYVVKLPFKNPREHLDDSKSIAIRKFISLEKRLLANNEVYLKYKEFMSEYLALKHMEEIPKDVIEKNNEGFYIPHHAVFKESSLTTKLRVVFNASSKCKNGVSLNDVLINGPKVQDDLFNILLRFRCYEIAIIGDLEKMYRQVNINEDDRNYQKILWRDNPDKPIKPYRLTTVTYGTKPASYLATRVLKQLVLDEGFQFPQAAKIIEENCYVDDVLFGVDTPDKGVKLISDLCHLFSKGGFSLHKWCSNDKHMLHQALDLKDRSESIYQILENKFIKVLGLKWDSEHDVFFCDFEIPDISEDYTKRVILSSIAKIYDPLGWLAPFIIAAKILIQMLWKFQISWDDPVPKDISQLWSNYITELHHLQKVQIPRKVILFESKIVELHAFCDASEKAYAAVVYIKTVNMTSNSIKLLTSKTRVTPLKTITIPRLELCAALLLSNLVKAVMHSLTIKIDHVYAWTDSTIVLAWLNSEPCRWQTFVANRVSQIQSILPESHWNHINSRDNPADCASRGLIPSELISHELWWSGPEWLLSNNLSIKDQIQISEEALLEEKKKIVCSINNTIETDLSFIYNLSSYSKLKRIVAWLLRFLHNAKNPSTRLEGFLSTLEITRARNLVVSLVQKQEFPHEYELLANKKPLSLKSKLAPLNPFIGTDGLIRVGGRLRNANMHHDSKNPLILPKNHHLTDIIIDYFHKVNLHAGPELLLSLLRQEFWIINARSVIRSKIWKCLQCHRLKAQTAKQVMADLPTPRVTPARTFSIVGIDYAGPFFSKPRQGRGIRPIKVYVCFFVCFVTKAVHLELVGSLTSNSFLSALKRFVSRRGRPVEIYSDCGTNFVSANKELQKIIRSLKSDKLLNQFYTDANINWNFNPPSAPHFGGLWEAAVKSAKTHIKRTIGDQILTLEEFNTLLTQVEACMNSRPLCPLPNEPSELDVLTPAHFLIGEPFNAVPEEDIADCNIPLSQRWKLTQKMLQNFWKRWSKDYLTSLQRRTKWTKVQNNIKVNDLVLIKDDNMPPLKWRLGRIIEVHPGSDNLVRVVTVKTSTGQYKRPIHKLCPLPIND